LSSDRASHETDLERRQGRLQAEAEQLLADLDLAALLAHIGPIRMAGSFVSGLMTWREVDVGVCTGSDFGSEQVLNTLARLVGRSDHDHANVTAWHERLREGLTPDQRVAILQIKTAWHDRPEYPDDVGGQDVYTAVIDHQVRTPAQFAAWLDDRSR
jgi:hypothetical protein